MLSRDVILAFVATAMLLPGVASEAREHHHGSARTHSHHSARKPPVICKEGTIRSVHRGHVRCVRGRGASLLNGP